MSEQDNATFNVVDKRATVTGDSDPDLTETAEAEVLDSPGDSDASGPGNFMPDPGMLLNMAAVQLDTVTLIHSLIPIFDQYAWSAMGFIADPKSGEPVADLPTAKIAIDSVQFLLSKVEAQLSESERRDMQRRLSDLRINYVNKLNNS